jgi:hypothetical protein
MKRGLVNLIVLVSVGLALGLAGCHSPGHHHAGVNEAAPHGLTGTEDAQPQYQWQTKQVETPRGRRVMYERVEAE